MVYVLVSPARTPSSAGPSPPPAVDDRSPDDLLPPPPQLPPPPPLGPSSRPERLADRLKGGAGASGTGRRSPAVADRSPEDLPPLPPPLGLRRPERLGVGDDAGPAGRKRRASPGAGGDCGRRRSPPRRSPSPEPPKRARCGSSWNECKLSRGKGRRSCSRSPDQTRSGHGSTSNVQDYTEREGLMTYKQLYKFLMMMFHQLKLRAGTLDIGPGLTACASNKSGNGNDGSFEGDFCYDGKKRIHGRDCQKDIKLLSDAPKAHPVSAQYRRIQTDIDQTLALVKKIDSEKGIVGNILSTDERPNTDKSHGASMGPVKGLEGVELLDTLLTYLWRVHGVDYYGMSEMKCAKGFRHVRAENKSVSMSKLNAADWENKLDSFWQERLMDGEDPLVVLTAKKKIDAETVEVLDRYVRKVRTEKHVWAFGCGAKGCAKFFHAPEFVHKHLRLKHPDLVDVLTSRVKDEIYFQNYMNDPDAPGGTALLQHSVPDTTTHGPDQQMYVASDRRGSDAPPVPALLPSPLLIPVPGAGPLGPFVPAPTEVAMRIRQGQPGPDAAQGRKLATLGLPMYPSFPLGSHHFRSYQDLDAPEEEVVAIDFRRL